MPVALLSSQATESQPLKQILPLLVSRPGVLELLQTWLMIIKSLNRKTKKSVGLSYSLYRKKFKEYTGISPAQYQIQLSIDKTKDLLIATQKPLKELAMSCTPLKGHGFQIVKPKAVTITVDSCYILNSTL